MHNLIHINEALSGLPVDVDFIDFETARSGDLSRYKVIINAGKAGDAWSGGDNWKDVKVVEAITKWVYEGGCFIGIGEPSATSGYDTFFRLAQVLGVDEDNGARVCHGKWEYEVKAPQNHFPLPHLLNAWQKGFQNPLSLFLLQSLPPQDNILW